MRGGEYDRGECPKGGGLRKLPSLAVLVSSSKCLKVGR